jgi:hypothetical protein
MATGYPAAVTLAYNAIMRSSVFKLNGPAIDLPRALALLGQAAHKYDLPEGVWECLGEFTEACLGDLIVGAYWALSEWSGGQASDTYVALCSLGQVFKPGMTSGPEVDSGEFMAYELICDWFKEREDR